MPAPLLANRDQLDPLLAQVYVRLAQLRAVRTGGAVVRQTGSLLEFIPRVTASTRRYVSPVHLTPLCEAIERSMVEPVRLVVHTPPRHGKTDTLLWSIPWQLQRMPTRNIAYLSYASEFAHSKSQRCQRFASEAGLTWSGSRAEWRTPQGGGVLATGMGAAFTGQGADLLLVDDPVKNRLEAESPLMREHQWDWFTDVGLTRLDPGASVIVFMARWHEDDLAGRLVRAGWPYLRLPAIAEDDDDPLVRLGLREVGGALWPERYPLAALMEIKDDRGAYSWDSLYAGRPAIRGGSVFRDVHFYDMDALPTSGYRLAIGVDFAYSTATRADWSVALAMMRHGDVYYVLDVWRGQVEAPVFAATLAAWREKYQAPLVAYIGGTERGTVDLMRHVQPGVDIEARPAIGDKLVRALPVAAAWNSGRVLLPRDARWLNAFIGEVTGFTGVGDAHDDQVDPLASAYDRLNDQGLNIRWL